MMLSSAMMWSSGAKEKWMRSGIAPDCRAPPYRNEWTHADWLSTCMQIIRVLRQLDEWLNQQRGSLRETEMLTAWGKKLGKNK